MSGFDAQELARSATGTLHWNWTKGGLAAEAPLPVAPSLSCTSINGAPMLPSPIAQSPSPTACWLAAKRRFRCRAHLFRSRNRPQGRLSSRCRCHYRHNWNTRSEVCARSGGKLRRHAPSGQKAVPRTPPGNAFPARYSDAAFTVSVCFVNTSLNLGNRAIVDRYFYRLPLEHKAMAHP